MNLRKNLGRVASTIVATALLASVATVPAFAAEIGDGVATSADNNIKIKQDIDVSGAEDANNPEVIFTYKIEANTDTNGSDSSLPVYAGIMPTGQTGDWTVQSVFDGTETKSGTVVSDTFEIDFTNVAWSGVGVYRYKLTQSNDNKAVDLDDNTVRYLDVYVGNADTGAGYKVMHYVLSTDGKLIYDKDGDGDNTYDHGTKSGGFTADYDTYTLTVKKYVTGDMGNKNDDFAFTVKFTNLPDGVKVYNGTTNVDGDVTGTLSDGETITITGIPAVGKDGNAVSYVVSEKFATNLGYSTEYEVNANINAWDGTNATNPTSKPDGTDTTMTAASQDMNADETNCIEFNNSRNSSTPTGIVMNIAPYALLVVVAVAGCFVFLRKRNED